MNSAGNREDELRQGEGEDCRGKVRRVAGR